MTPLPLALASTPDGSNSSPSPTASQHDRPERSRNAKAQARHRAKRKAYIEQLEQTVTKLQYALSLSPEQVAALPPPVMRIRELEEENQQLLRQVQDLRKQLEDRNTRMRAATSQRSGPTVLPTFDDRESDHDAAKRRHTMESSDDLSMWNQMAQGSAASARQNHQSLQLAIPREHHAYSQPAVSASVYHQSPSTPMMHTSYPVQYQFPEAHSHSPGVAASPATHSFSAENHYSPSMMHSQPQSPHVSSSSYSSQVLHPYARSTSQYDHVVKIEEDAYSVPHGMSQGQSNGYSSALPSFGGSNSGLGNWHGYANGA